MAIFNSYAKLPEGMFEKTDFFHLLKHVETALNSIDILTTSYVVPLQKVVNQWIGFRKNRNRKPE